MLPIQAKVKIQKMPQDNTHLPVLVTQQCNKRMLDIFYKLPKPIESTIISSIYNNHKQRKLPLQPLSLLFHT